LDDEQEKFRLLLTFEAFQTILHWVLFTVTERRSFFFFFANLIFLNKEKIVLVQEIVLFYRFTKIDILI